VWEVRTGRRLAELREHLSAVNSAEFSPDGKFILTASTDHTARIWKVGDW
jgi:WD40 repeat protein